MAKSLEGVLHSRISALATASPVAQAVPPAVRVMPPGLGSDFAEALVEGSSVQQDPSLQGDVSLWL